MANRRLLALAALLVTATIGRAAEVKVVGDKCVLVDGEPFFPIGFYSAGSPRDFPIIAGAGFNTVHTYAWEGMRTCESGRAWLDAAHDNGLMALVGLYRPDVKAMELDVSVARIEELRDHPALLAWHTMDEPAWDKEGDRGREYMPAAYELVKAHDANHPVTAVVCHFNDTELFEPSVDVMQADYYPIPPIPADWYSGTGFRGVKMFVDKWREASGGEKPFWYVGQIFDFTFQKEKSYEVPDEWKRLPTRDEIRCMTYTAVASGARGILYWSLSRLMGDAWSRGLLPRVRLWEDLKQVAAELNELMPLLTADTPETRQERDGVVAMVKSDGRDTYVIAANYERKSTNTEIGVPGMERATAELLFADGSAEIRGGKFRAHFLPLETRVYRIHAR